MYFSLGFYQSYIIDTEIMAQCQLLSPPFTKAGNSKCLIYLLNGLDYGFWSHETRVWDLILLHTGKMSLGMSFYFLFSLR